MFATHNYPEMRYYPAGCKQRRSSKLRFVNYAMTKLFFSREIKTGMYPCVTATQGFDYLRHNGALRRI
ncbi:hypothetical protein [Calothrix sp. PCC 6303]|uniref:hypothetical protein n=1 Tax=Calothrix sp. PCC 6303 TaxID=1170562 RepID=UPI00130EA7FA|nr:hypothetical protein [Calothrix sp. PCC 6303]